MTLTEFLLARIAEDEAAARQAPVDPLGMLKFGALAEGHEAQEKGEPGADALLWMAQRLEGRVNDIRPRTLHDPARVLARCEADRRIVELHTPDHECTDGSDSYPGVMGAGMFEPYCPTLRALALPYADHPDYREEWKP